MQEVKDTILYSSLLRRMKRKAASNIRALFKPRYKDCLSEFEFKEIACLNFKLTSREARRLYFELKAMGLIKPMKRGFKIVDGAEDEKEE